MLSVNMSANAFHSQKLRTDWTLDAIRVTFKMKLFVHFQVSRERKTFAANLAHWRLMVRFKMDSKLSTSREFLFAKLALGCGFVETFDVILQTRFMRKLFGAIVASENFCCDAVEAHMVVKHNFIDERLRAKFAFVRPVAWVGCHMNYNEINIRSGLVIQRGITYDWELSRLRVSCCKPCKTSLCRCEFPYDDWTPTWIKLFRSSGKRLTLDHRDADMDSCGPCSHRNSRNSRSKIYRSGNRKSWNPLLDVFSSSRMNVP